MNFKRSCGSQSKINVKDRTMTKDTDTVVHWMDVENAIYTSTFDFYGQGNEDINKMIEDVRVIAHMWVEPDWDEPQIMRGQVIGYKTNPKMELHDWDIESIIQFFEEEVENV